MEINDRLLKELQWEVMDATREVERLEGKEKAIQSALHFKYLAFAVLLLGAITLGISVKYQFLTEELQDVKSTSFKPAQIMQPAPVIFSKYYVIDPMDNCPPLDLVVLDVTLSCSSFTGKK
jgi:hypothetical protein